MKSLSVKASFYGFFILKFGLHKIFTGLKLMPCHERVHEGVCIVFKVVNSCTQTIKNILKQKTTTQASKHGQKERKSNMELPFYCLFSLRDNNMTVTKKW